MQKQPESTGDKGVQLICQFEGLKLERYRDAVGLWTIGYGHLILKEEMEKLIKITTGEAKTLLRKDLKRTEDGVKKLLTTAVNPEPVRRAGVVCLQPGVGNLKKSTLLKNSTPGISTAQRCSSKAGTKRAAKFDWAYPTP
jgi:GH24 family phage-related lysozyme (muramidase)